jgi:hypothetical protein
MFFLSTHGVLDGETASFILFVKRRLTMQTKKRNFILCLCILLSLAQFSCNDADTIQAGANQSASGTALPSNPTWDTSPIQDAEVQSFKSMLDKVTAGVGKVGDTKGAASGRRFVVFEEKHTSIASQFEIALMLLRLYEHGLRDIVLEGLTDDKKFPDTQWFRNLGGPEDEDVRNDVLVGLMHDGEISAVELIAMAFPDVVVHAGDDAVAYNTELTKQAGVSSTIYLYKIGLKSVRQDQYRRLNQLNQQQKISELIEFVISQDAWAKERHERFKKSGGGNCIEDILREFNEIEARAESVSAELTPEERRSMSDAKAFFEAADKRSHTTVKLAVGAESKSPLVAVNIGAAHTCGVKRLLDEAKPTYAILTPLSHPNSAGDLNYESFERKGDLRSVTWAGKGLGSLIDGRKKPPPVAGEDWLKSLTQARLATVLLLRAFRANGGLGDDLKRRLDSFANFRVDQSSLTFEDGVLSFKGALIGGQTKVIYMKAATPTSPAITRRRGPTLEAKLLNGLTSVKSETGERKQPATAPVIEVITPDVVAAAATEPQALMNFRKRI